MRGEKGIQALREELLRITNFIEDFGTEEESEDEDVVFADDVLDALDWVMGEISNKDFRNPPYLNMANLQQIVKNIEERTGEELSNNQ